MSVRVRAPLGASDRYVAGLLILSCLGHAPTLAAEAPPAYELAAAYTGDLLYNATGGLRRGNAYLDNLDITLTIDGESAWSVPGLQVYLHGLYNNGSTFSDRYVGDAFVVSNIDTERAVRLYEAWADWRFGTSGSTSLRLGLYDLNSEFDAVESRGLFVNSAYGIGQDLAQTGENGPSIFPATALAARLAWAPADDWLVEVAAIDGVPGDPDDPKRTHIDLSGDDGALLAAEITTAFGAVTQLSIGRWRYTADFDDLVATDAFGDPVRRDDNHGTYVTAEFALAANRRTFVRAGTANGDINAFDRYYAAGLVLDNVLPGSRGDQFGVAVAAGRASGPYRALVAASGDVTDGHEYNVELTWRIPVNEYLVVQPDIQYVLNPGVAGGIDDALVFGLRFELARAWGWGSRGPR